MSAQDNAAKPEVELVDIEINGQAVKAPKGAMIIQAADEAPQEFHIPRFCYHKKLPIAANCRMCLVEVEKAPKPLPACATPIMPGMKIFTNSERALAAQKGVMEFLLINHPLDCPVCDQGGECELQDTALGYGRGVSRFTEGKRAVDDKDIGPLIATEMTRCIHCTRCVRFLDVVGGFRELGGMGRGEKTEISTYVEHSLTSELSGNIVDLCPVGALTSKTYRFKARPWELQSRRSVAMHDAVGSNVEVHYRRGDVMRVVPAENESLNEVWLSDRDRYAYEGINSDNRALKPMIKDGGQWKEVEWEAAISAASTLLKGVAPDALATYVSPSATTEEGFLASRITRGLGSGNVDYRLRLADTSDQDQSTAFPAFGRKVESFETLQAALIVGSHLRQEAPILNHRVRKAAVAGAKVSFVNPRSFKLNFPVAQNIVTSLNGWAQELAAIAKVLLESTNQAMPKGFKEILGDFTVTESHQQIAVQLREAKEAAVIVGEIAYLHPAGSVIRSLAALIAKLAHASYGNVVDGANGFGLSLAGVLPHRDAGYSASKTSGKNASASMDNLAAALLVNVDPANDFYNPSAASKALANAKTIALVTHVTDSIRATADVILPIAAFAETSGTLVNGEGRWLSFTGVVQPKGDARPGWKVLRVLGNYLGLADFDYMSSEEVLAAVKKVAGKVGVPASTGWKSPSVAWPVNTGLSRAGEVAMYSADALLRNAKALQATQAPWAEAVWLNPKTAGQLNVSEGDTVDVQQDGQSAKLAVCVSSEIPVDVVWTYVGTSASTSLGAPYAPVTITRI